MKMLADLQDELPDEQKSEILSQRSIPNIGNKDVLGDDFQKQLSNQEVRDLDKRRALKSYSERINDSNKASMYRAGTLIAVLVNEGLEPEDINQYLEENLPDKALRHTEPIKHALEGDFKELYRTLEEDPELEDTESFLEYIEQTSYIFNGVLPGLAESGAKHGELDQGDLQELGFMEPEDIQEKFLYEEDQASGGGNTEYSATT